MVTPKKGLAAYLEASKVPDVLFGDIQRHVLWKAGEQSDRRIDCIHPSEAIKDDWCIRANYFKIMTNVAYNPRQTTFRMENIFQEGHNTHSKWQRWLAEMGKLSGDWKCNSCDTVFFCATTPDTCPEESCVADARFTYEELRLENKELRISGRTDGHIPSERMLLEVKTMGFGGLKWDQPQFVEPYEKYMNGKSWVALENLWRDFRRPLKSARRQGQLYLWLARAKGIDVDKILFIYDFKANQEAKSFLINFDETVIEDVLANCRIICDAVTAGVAPECNVRGEKLCPQCQPYEEEK